MSETPTAPPKASGPAGHAPAPNAHAADSKSGPRIHRVCIGCNNMFEVPMDNYEAKHCSICHKG